MTPLERAARAMASESGVSDWKHVPEHGDYGSREYWRRLAKASLAAIREPSEPMVAAFFGTAICQEHIAPAGAVEEVWQAMIDAALAELP